MAARRRFERASSARSLAAQSAPRSSQTRAMRAQCVYDAHTNVRADNWRGDPRAPAQKMEAEVRTQQHPGQAELARDLVQRTLSAPVGSSMMRATGLGTSPTTW